MLKDSIYEMMAELQYQVWAAKPKNGGKSPAAASLTFGNLVQAPNAVTDELGDTVEYKTRVAVKVKDLLIDRDASVQRWGYELKEKENKNTTADDVNNLHRRMLEHSVEDSNPQCALDMVANAKSLMSSIVSLADGANAAEVSELKRKAGDLKAMAEDAENQAKQKKPRTEASSSTGTTGDGFIRIKKYLFISIMFINKDNICSKPSNTS